MPLSDWTAEERAGQHIVGGFPGLQPPPSLLQRIREGRLGGVILFSRNIDSAEQTLELTHSLQRAAAQSPRRVPLLIAIDEEGGRVSRLSSDFTRFPSAAAFGRIGDLALARKAAAVTGAELRMAGITLDLAPVLDLATNPACTVIGDRAFGENPFLVGAIGAAVVSGLQGTGVAAAAKHFPGIGDMAPDPHAMLPFSDLSLEAIHGRELLPYSEALSTRLAGGPVAAVLMAHAVYTQIDADRPASLSPVFARDLLRKELRYPGVAITDDLEMGAIEDPAEAAVSAVAAGVDIALICHSEAFQEDAFERLVQEIEKSRVGNPGNLASLRRILGMKSHFGEPIEYFERSDHLARLQAEMQDVVGCEAHRLLQEEILRLEQIAND